MAASDKFALEMTIHPGLQTSAGRNREPLGGFFARAFPQE